MMQKAYCDADGEWAMWMYGHKCDMRRRLPNHVAADGDDKEMECGEDGMVWMDGMCPDVKHPCSL